MPAIGTKGKSRARRGVPPRSGSRRMMTDCRTHNYEGKQGADIRQMQERVDREYRSPDRTATKMPMRIVPSRGCGIADARC